MMDDDQHEAYGAMIHRGKVEQGTINKLTARLRFVKRFVAECGDIKERMVLQQALYDVNSGELTWIDVPICDETTGTQV